MITKIRRTIVTPNQMIRHAGHLVPLKGSRINKLLHYTMRIDGTELPVVSLSVKLCVNATLVRKKSIHLARNIRSNQPKTFNLTGYKHSLHQVTDVQAQRRQPQTYLFHSATNCCSAEISTGCQFSWQVHGMADGSHCDKWSKRSQNT